MRQRGGIVREIPAGGSCFGTISLPYAMQTTFLLTAALLASALSGANAQSATVQFGLKAGLNLSVLDGQINQSANFKPGVVLGGFLRWRPTERIAIQPELVFSQQGSKLTANYLGHKAEEKVRLNYLNIPLLAKVYLGKVVNLQVGPQFGLLLSGQRTGQNGYYTGSNGSGYFTEDVDVRDSYKNDFALCGGIGLDLPNGLLVAARINYGLSNIDNDDNTLYIRHALDLGDLHNRTIQVSLGYALPGKK